MARYGMAGEPSHSPGVSLNTTHTFQKSLIHNWSPQLSQEQLSIDLATIKDNHVVIEENLPGGTVWRVQETFIHPRGRLESHWYLPEVSNIRMVTIVTFLPVKFNGISVSWCRIAGFEGFNQSISIFFIRNDSKVTRDHSETFWAT